MTFVTERFIAFAMRSVSSVPEAPTSIPATIRTVESRTKPVAEDISIATTRRVARYTPTREGEETIVWAQGEIATERWRRSSEDGNLHAIIWLAPSLRYVPVRMRVTGSYRGIVEATLEATLDSIRVDETMARQ